MLEEIKRGFFTSLGMVLLSKEKLDESLQRLVRVKGGEHAVYRTFFI